MSLSSGNAALGGGLKVISAAQDTQSQITKRALASGAPSDYKEEVPAARFWDHSRGFGQHLLTCSPTKKGFERNINTSIKLKENTNRYNAKNREETTTYNEHAEEI